MDQDLRNYLETNKKTKIGKLVSEGKYKNFRSAFHKEDNDGLYFFRPTKDDVAVDFSHGEKIRFLIYTVDGIFVFETKVLKLGAKLIMTEKPESFKRIQRRGLLRQPLPLDVKMSFTLDGKRNSTSVKVVDVSGSGISFNTNVELFDLKRVFISFRVGDGLINSYADIVEIRKNVKPENGLYRVSTKFVSLNQKDIDLIAKNCINHQIKVSMEKFKKGS